MDKKILLVEGKSDVEFFSCLTKNINAFKDIQIIDAHGFNNLEKTLPKLLQQISTGGTLGIVIDADYESSDNGFINRRQAITNTITSHDPDYVISESAQWRGDLFAHNDGLNSLGLWVMPDHISEGMLETLLLDCISPNKRQMLLDEIQVVINQVFSNEALSDIRFKDVHKDKTLFNTWLFWQRQPNHCRNLKVLECAFSRSWIETEHKNLRSILDWLDRTFN